MLPNDQEIRRQFENEAIMGELAGIMVHEFNNFLNTLLLQVTLMETSAPATLVPDLNMIRQEGKNIAKIIKDWQRMKKPRPDVPQSFDINQIVRDLLDQGTGSFPAAKTMLELSEGSLWMQGSFLELSHLAFLLIQIALKESESHSGEEGNVVIRTQKKQQQAFLSVVDNGPLLTPEALSQIFDPVRSTRSGLELAACKALARRLGGRLYAENNSQGGIAISFVTFAADS